MLSSMLLLLLSLSVSGSLVILLIFAVCLPLQKKLSHQWQYYIWIAVIFRLLLPFSPTDNLMGHLFWHLQYTLTNTAVSVTPGNSCQNADSKTTDISGTADKQTNYGSSLDTSTTDNIQSSLSESASNTDINGTVNIFKTLVIYAAKKLWKYHQYIFVFWLMTAMLLFLRKITVYQDFIRFIQAGSTPVDDIERLETLAEAETQLGIHKAIDLWSSNLISSPMLIGFRHPYIILPERDIPKQAFYYTVMHELTHYKRLDMYYKWLLQFTICIHWFNPLVYVMAKYLNRLCELSCDEAVIDHLESTDQRRAYAATLLNAMASDKHSYREQIASLTLTENKKLLKERMEYIMRKKEITTTKKILVTILTAAITATGIFSGSFPADASVYKTQTNPTDTYTDTELSTDTTLNSDTAPNPDTNLSSDTGTNLKKGTQLAIKKANHKRDEITSEQADEMALALTNKIWVWDWVEFFVPYMTQEGAEKLVSASKHSEWAGYVDQTSGKKLKFTKKQVNAARKDEPSEPLTCKDIDNHALMIMQSNGDWDCISFMLPYMSKKGIQAVTRCYNSKHGDEKKHAADYY